MKEKSLVRFDDRHREAARYRTILEAIAAQVWVSDAQGTSFIVLAGEPGPTGYGPVDIQQGLELVHQEDQTSLLQGLELAVKNGTPLNTIVRGKDVNGEWRKFKIQSQPIRDAQGAIVEWVGVSTDVTRQEEAEAELRRQHEGLLASQQRLNVALTASCMGVWEYDIQQKSSTFSPEVYSILRTQQPASDLAQLQCVLHAEDYARLKPLTLGVLDWQEHFQEEVRYQGDDGIFRWIQVNAKPIYDASGTIKSLTGTVQDISNRKLKDQWLRTQNEILKQIASGASVQQVFSSIMQLIEYGTSGSVGTLMLVDQGRLHLVAGSRLPEEMATKLVDIPIGPNVGSCGTAAYLGETVICENIHTDPRWEQYRTLTHFGLQSCWSTPVMASSNSEQSPTDNRVIGVLAIYFREPCRPSESQLKLISQAVHLAAIAIDRHQSEQSLRNSELRFRELANAMPLLVWTSDASGACTYGNQMLKDAIGEHKQLDWLSVIHPDDRDMVIDRYRHAMQTGEAYTVEHRMKTIASNEYRWFLARSIASFDDNGKVTAWYGAATDIDDLKRTEAVLRDERDRFSAIASASPSVMFSYTRYADGRRCLPYAAPSFAELIGIPPDQLVADANPAINLVHPEDLVSIVDQVRRASMSGKSISIAFRIKHPSKGEVWIECQATPIPGSDGSITWHGVLTDITQRREIEEKLSQAAKMEAIGRLAGGIAHDFNNLLTVVIGGCDLLEHQLTSNNNGLENLNAIRQASLRAAGLTKQLLAFSRQQKYAPQYVNPNRVLEDSRIFLQRLIGNSIQLAIHMHPEAPLIFADPVQIEQILINLAVNSRDAMPSGGILNISTQPADRDGIPYAVVSVSDSGCGMEPEVKSRIFEPFFTTKSVGKGTGLGLAVVHGIVSQSNGIIEVDSTVGKGTTIHVLFPAITSKSHSIALGTSDPTHPGGKETIVLVDDEVAITDIYSRALQAMGYQVLRANSASEAMQLVEQWPGKVDALITDLVMPECPGDRLVSMMQQRYPHIKILIMSGHDGLLANPQEALRGNDFLLKPFTPSELASKLRSILERSASSKG